MPQDSRAAQLGIPGQAAVPGQESREREPLRTAVNLGSVVTSAEEEVVVVIGRASRDR